MSCFGEFGDDMSIKFMKETMRGQILIIYRTDITMTLASKIDV